MCMANEKKMYKLINANGDEYLSPEKGAIGGYRNGGQKIYGKLNCKNALNWIAKGHYVKHRVFFKDEATAIAAGYHPCGKCMKDHYKLYKEGKIIPGNLEETRKHVDFL